MGPTLMNCCRPEQMDTKEFGKMVKRFQTLEEGSVRERSFKGCWNWAKEKIVKERGELPNEEGDVVRECKAMQGLMR